MKRGYPAATMGAHWSFLHPRAGRLFAQGLLILAACGPAWADAPSTASLLKQLHLVEYRPGTVSPGLSGVTLDGRRLALANLRGKVVLVNFWASWCAECRPEMPVLERLHREFAAQGLAVIGVNFHERKDTVGRYARDLGLSFPLVLDTDGAISAGYGVFGLPATFVIARDGHPVAFAVGIRNWESEPARALIRTLLAGPARGANPPASR